MSKKEMVVEYLSKHPYWTRDWSAAARMKHLAQELESEGIRKAREAE